MSTTAELTDAPYIDSMSSWQSAQWQSVHSDIRCFLDKCPLFIASEASNLSLKRKSPKQTRTNSIFAKIHRDGLTEELRHSKCISDCKSPRIHYISILPAKLINIPKNLVVMSLKWCSDVILTVPLANATDTVTLLWQWLDTFVALSCVKSMAGIMIIDKIYYSRVQKLGGKHLQHCLDDSARRYRKDSHPKSALCVVLTLSAAWALPHRTHRPLYMKVTATGAFSMMQYVRKVSCALIIQAWTSIVASNNK